MRKAQGWRRRMTRVPRILKLMWLLQKPAYQFLTAWLSEILTWKENELQISGCLIVGKVSLNWKLGGCCNFRTFNSWLHDCQRLEFERKSNVQFLTAWLSEAWTWNENWTPTSRPHACPEPGSGMKLKQHFTTWHSFMTGHSWRNSGAYWIPRDDLVSSSMFAITASHEMHDRSNR